MFVFSLGADPMFNVIDPRNAAFDGIEEVSVGKSGSDSELLIETNLTKSYFNIGIGIAVIVNPSVKLLDTI